jgi:hypothetical protein
VAGIHPGQVPKPDYSKVVGSHPPTTRRPDRRGPGDVKPKWIINGLHKHRMLAMLYGKTFVQKFKNHFNPLKKSPNKKKPNQWASLLHKNYSFPFPGLEGLFAMAFPFLAAFLGFPSPSGFCSSLTSSWQEDLITSTQFVEIITTDVGTVMSPAVFVFR